MLVVLQKHVVKVALETTQSHETFQTVPENPSYADVIGFVV